MRSLMIGDCDYYASPYMRGVAQAMRLLGHEHAEVSIRLPAKTIESRLQLWKPAIVWTHMLLWAPPLSPPTETLIDIVTESAPVGAKVVIHDGDAKPATRYAHDISLWCDLALVNHAYDRSAWNVPTLRWPYFAPVQESIAEPSDRYRCELFFAGSGGGGIYSARTGLVGDVIDRGVKVLWPDHNTIDETAVVAASADAVLGFGRPDVPGWVDTRVFSYPGAGGVLLHDDVQGYLEPWVHYVPYESGNADSVVDSLARLNAVPADHRIAIRRNAFHFVQAHHSSVARVSQVLTQLGLA